MGDWKIETIPSLSEGSRTRRVARASEREKKAKVAGKSAQKKRLIGCERSAPVGVLVVLAFRRGKSLKGLLGL
jgi:hypothetical protein